MDVEHRLSPRYKITVPVDIANRRAVSYDLSAGGVSIDFAPFVAVGEQVEFDLHAPSTGLVLKCSGRVVRVEERPASLSGTCRLAIAFDDVTFARAAQMPEQEH